MRASPFLSPRSTRLLSCYLPLSRSISEPSSVSFVCCRRILLERDRSPLPWTVL